MKMGAFGSLLGLVICFIGLLVLGSKGSDRSHQVSLLVVALAMWLLEHKALLRTPLDFSTGLVYPLVLGIAGFPVEATLLIISSVFIRQLGYSDSHPWDLVALCPGLTIFGLVHVLDKPSLFWGVMGLLVSAFALHFVSLSSLRSLKGQEKWLIRATEKQLSVARLAVLPLGLIGLAGVKESLWIAILILPPLLLVNRFSGDLGYRLEAMWGERARQEVVESRQHLVHVHSKLKTLSEKQQMMETLVTVFKENLGPREAFSELRRITCTILSYDALFWLRVELDGNLQIQDYCCEDHRWERHESLDWKSEPLLAKAWAQDRAVMGRLAQVDSHIVIVPLKPLGILCFGRGRRPFSKEEASRLRFVSERAEGGLKRAQERAEFTLALAEEKRVSRQLAHKVNLSSHLLSAAQKILGAPTERSIYDTLENFARRAVDHRWGAVLTPEAPEPVAKWGCVPKFSELDRAHFLSPEGGGAIRLIDESNIAIAYPIRGEAEALGVLLVGRSGEQNLTVEERDFLGTLALLVGGGLEALHLNARLKEAHQKVLQASKLSAIGRLAAGVAHELNSPLAAIGLAIESAMLRPEKVSQKLSKASNALERARRIESDLLQHSRKTGSARTLVPLGTVFEGLLRLVEAQLLDRRLKLQKTCKNPEAGILINKDELDQILINLILNAADASEDGKTIEVLARAEYSKVFIEVRDSGSGIPEENQSRVFDPFFTTKDVGRGTGLGLSVCRELVLRHQGQICFDTELSKGTTFRLTFPRQDDV